MGELTAWLTAFAFALVAYAIYWGFTLGRNDRTADDYFLAGGQTPAWQFVLAATALSVTGWLCLGHPGMVFQYGLPFAQTDVAAVMIPLAGVLFLKRTWMLARSRDVRTPAALLGEYFQSELLRAFVLLVALTFAVPFVGLQLSACGQLIERLTGGQVDRYGASWIVGFATFIYVYLGGLRGVIGVGALQSLLMLVTMVAMGVVAYWQLGGVDAFARGIGALAKSSHEGAGSLLEISGVVQFTSGLGSTPRSGGVWTAATVLGYGLALLGLQAAPSFVMLGMSARDTKGFAPQQVWAGAAIAGFIVLVFVALEGMAGRILGTPGMSADTLHADLLRLLATDQPGLSALLTVGLIATVQFTAAICVWTTSAMFAQDVCQRYFDPTANDARLRIYARTTLAVLFVVALAMGTFTPTAQAQLGTLALGFALQLWPAWAGLTRIRWISAAGVNVGLGVGLAAVILTEDVGGTITHFFGLDLPWGRWPWTIHSAGWGLFLNLLFCFLVSIVSSRGDARDHRDTTHDEFAARDAMTPRRSVMRPAVWALAIVWVFFALGPGAVLGNDFLGATSPAGKSQQGWTIGVPALWLWQMLWWAFGVVLIWWLAYKLELATPPRTLAELERERSLTEAAYFAELERRRAATRDVAGESAYAGTGRSRSTG